MEAEKNHSTDTALVCISYHMRKQYEDNKITATIQTDLSSAFDTIDHSILLLKLDHYGIINSENKLMESFLENQLQCVSIDSFNSEVKKVSIVPAYKDRN